MISNEMWNLSLKLRQISTYTKNLILFKSEASGRNKAHIKSFQSILERKIGNDPIYESFFNDKENSITVQLLVYLRKCGEVTHVDSGYYTVLPARYIRLPASQSIIKIGELKEKEENRTNLGLALKVKEKIENQIELTDYRFDLDLEKWLLIFKKSTKKVFFFNEEYFKATKNGFKKLRSDTELKEDEIYYIKSYPPLGDMKEYYAARKVKGVWQGVKVNSNFYKSRLALLYDGGYQMDYRVIQSNNTDDEKSVFQVDISDFLPKVEREQVYLFTIPKQLKYCKTYYVSKENLDDFIFVLKSLRFIERNE